MPDRWNGYTRQDIDVVLLQVVLEYAGKDATDAFEGVGHSRSARRWKDKFIVARVKKS